jgi:hypothetical protein
MEVTVDARGAYLRDLPETILCLCVNCIRHAIPMRKSLLSFFCSASLLQIHGLSLPSHKKPLLSLAVNKMEESIVRLIRERDLECVCVIDLFQISIRE